MDDKQKAAMAEGRRKRNERLAAEKAEREAHPEVVAAVDAGNVAVEPGVITANGHANVLDIADPVKWQMKVRLFLERSEPEEAERWMEGYRLVFQMAGAVVRELVYGNVTRRCYICNKPFVDGKPAGEAGYFDADRQYIKVYCCHNAEYPRLLEKVQQKEGQITLAVERAEKAARQAMIDARSAARKQIPA